MTRLLLCGFQSSVEMIRRVATATGRHPIEVCGWAARQKWRRAIAEAMPGVDYLRIPLPEAPATNSWAPSLDERSARFSAVEEENVLYMLDRDFKCSTHLEARQLYYSVAGWASAVLETRRPELVVFSDVPHDAFSYLLYLLARRRGIATFMIKNSFVPHIYVYADTIDGTVEPVAEDFRRRLAAGEDGAACELSATTEGYLASLRRSYDEAAPQYMRKQMATHKGWRRRLRSLAREPARLLRGNPWRRAAAMVRRDAMRRSYERLAARRIDAQSPYVAVFLHLQPERSTMPEGGPFAHQWLMVNLLASALPLGWRIYVREHPSTFLPGPNLLRGEWFYRELLRCPGVELASTEIDPFAFADGARCVATVTGTVGFEAAARGVPALVFGSATYLGCEGVLAIKGREDCRAALEAARAGMKIDPGRIRLYLKALEESPRSYLSSYRLGEDIRGFYVAGEAHERLLERILEHHGSPP